MSPVSIYLFISIAAGQNTTYFLAKPNDKMSELPRHPDEVEHPEECIVCGKDEEGNSPLICEKVSPHAI